jgi:hypothetical protein
MGRMDGIAVLYRLVLVGMAGISWMMNHWMINRRPW